MAIIALHLSRFLYKFAPFYAKQTQFPKSQMNVKPYNTTDYENIANWTLGENKPNTKPIKPNTNPKQSQNKPNQTQNKPKQTQFLPKIRVKLNMIFPIPSLETFLGFSAQDV